MNRRWLRVAWPSGATDLLLQAAGSADLDAARAAWSAWGSTFVFEEAPGNHLRLFGAIASRIDSLDPESPLKPRLWGVQRMLWTQSHMAMAKTATALQTLAGLGITVMVFKGAARAATDPSAPLARIVNDIDVRLRREDFAKAFDALVAEGWKPAGSGSVAYHRAVLAGIEGINLLRGRYGNIDLHQRLFRYSVSPAAVEDAILKRAGKGTLGGIAVLVPSSADGILIAAAHGALDAHQSSDWLLDIAAIVEAGAVDWSQLVETARSLEIEAAAAIALGYVKERLSISVPDGALEALCRAAGRAPLRLTSVILQARPRDRLSPPFAVARGIAKQARMLSFHRRAKRGVDARIDVVWPRLPIRFRGDAAALGREWVTEHMIGALPKGPVTVDLVCWVPLSGPARRIEFEIHSAGHCVARLRFLKPRTSRRRAVRLRYAFSLKSGQLGGEGVFVAAPLRALLDTATAAERERYGVVPFVLESARIAGQR